MKTILVAGTVIAMVVLFVAGCSKAKKSEGSKDAQAAAAAKKQEIGDFKQLGLMYHSYLDANKDEPPASVDDFIKFAGANQQLLQVLQKVKSGQYVIVWGLKKNELVKNVSSIVGYEKIASTNGGVVMLGSGRAKYLTAAEFQSTPKVPGK